MAAAAAAEERWASSLEVEAARAARRRALVSREIFSRHDTKQ